MDTQTEVIDKLTKIFKIFQASEGLVRPHFILTGPSGSGKSHSIMHLAEEFELNYHEINAAQLTKEGTSGNSLSKALGPLKTSGNRLSICFVDEFDKLFISGNANSQLAHETTTGVQNEFLRVLESKKAAVYDDYGKYIDIPTDKVLFVFAGAFNGEENIDVDKLRSFGLKTEFLGRVGLCFNLRKLTLKELASILEKSTLLSNYLALFPKVKKKSVVQSIMSALEMNYEKDTLGARLINTFLHQYFISGGCLTYEEAKKTSFQKTLSL